MCTSISSCGGAIARLMADICCGDVVLRHAAPREVKHTRLKP
jgi:hypothetical protein